MMLAAQYTALSVPGLEPVEQVAAVIRAHLGPGDRWTAYGEDLFVRNLVFYVGAKETPAYDQEAIVALMMSKDRVIASVPAEEVATIERRALRPLRKLAEVPYVNKAGIRASTLRDPDPQQNIRTAVVLVNR
jgi:hypothetical protein